MMSAIQAAVRDKNIHVIDDVNAEDEHRCNALHYAVAYGFPDMVRALIEKGATVYPSLLDELFLHSDPCDETHKLILQTLRDHECTVIDYHEQLLQAIDYFHPKTVAYLVYECGVQASEDVVGRACYWYRISPDECHDVWLHCLNAAKRNCC